MKNETFVKLSKSLIRGRRAARDSLKLPSGVLKGFSWTFDDPFGGSAVLDFVVENWKEARDAGIWVFAEATGVTYEDGTMDDWRKAWLLPVRGLDVQVEAIQALAPANARTNEAIDLFKKLHATLGVDLYNLIGDHLGLKAPGSIRKSSLTPVVDEVIAFQRKYQSSSSREEAIWIMQSGIFLL
jgi:hypothetical protein